MLAAGVDLGGRTTGTTAAAWVEVSGDGAPRVRSVVADRSLRGDRELCDRLGQPAVVAIDAPLSLPHPVVRNDPTCRDWFPSDGSVPSYGTRTELESPSAWAEVEAVPPGVKVDRDRLDSVAAAFVGWLWLNGRARPVPHDASPGSPAIWIP